LADFGMGSLHTPDKLWGRRVYTPETVRGEHATAMTDIYALGCLLYEMLCGHPPFLGDSPVAIAMQHIQDTPQAPGEINGAIPPAFETAILSCLEKQPERRATAMQLVALLGDLA